MNFANISTQITESARMISRRLYGDAGDGPAATGCAAAARKRQRVTMKSTQIAAMAAKASQPTAAIGRAHVWTPVTTAHLVCRLLLAKKNQTHNLPLQSTKSS